LWTLDVSQALDRFISFAQEGALMTAAQKQHRQKILQRHQKKVGTFKPGRKSNPSCLPPPIPQALLDIIVRCLVPDRSQRFQVICRFAFANVVAAVKV
jgi:hypothetical protein